MLLLQQLLNILTPSGNEQPMRNFLISYFEQNKKLFKTEPVLYYGDDFQDCLAVRFGQPSVAIFAHMDTTGYMTRYGNQLIEIGSPEGKSGDVLVINKNGIAGDEIILEYSEDAEENDPARLKYMSWGNLALERGTELLYKPNYEQDKEWIHSPYLDNRIGLYIALKAAEEMKDGILIFTCWEEHQGGSAAHMARFAHDSFGVKKALISDITYATDGIKHGDGPVISLRDSAIPRRAYVKHICSIAEMHNIKYQLEVEEYGGSDGSEIQKIPYSIDWCFVGVACSGMHTSREKILKADLEKTIQFYRHLVETL